MQLDEENKAGCTGPSVIAFVNAYGIFLRRELRDVCSEFAHIGNTRIDLEARGG